MFRINTIKRCFSLSSSKRIDPYNFLGVNKQDDFKVIKKTYIKLVREHHPDLHQGDVSRETNDSFLTHLRKKRLNFSNPSKKASSRFSTIEGSRRIWVTSRIWARTMTNSKVGVLQHPSTPRTTKISSQGTETSTIMSITTEILVRMEWDVKGLLLKKFTKLSQMTLRWKREKLKIRPKDSILKT